MRGETVRTKCALLVLDLPILVTLTALPSAVTVKAESEGRFDDCRFSENVEHDVGSVYDTVALVSVGGVVSAVMA